MAVVVGEPDVAQFDPVVPRRDGACRLRQRSRADNLADAADRTPRGLQVVEAVAEGRDRGGQAQAQQQKRQQVGRGDAAGGDPHRAADQHDHKHEGRRQRQLHPGGDRGDAAHPPGEDVDEVVGGTEELLVSSRRASERLHHGDALHEFDDGTGDPAHRRIEVLLLTRTRWGHQQRDVPNVQQHGDNGDHGEPPVDGQQVDQRHQRHDKRGDELAGSVGDERVHGADVLADHLRQLAAASAGEPADRRAPKAGGQVPTQR
jgi:hypothetical protein